MFFQQVFGKRKIKEFEEKLELNNTKVNCINKFILFSIIAGIFVMIIGMVIAQYFFVIEKAIIVGIALFFLPFLINYLWQDVLFEKRKRQREESLADVLLEASIFCDENSMTQTIKKISELELGFVSMDFEKAYSEICNGTSVEKALKRIKKINKSETYSRVIDLFLQGYCSGVEMSELFKEMAEDIMENKAIIKERQAVMLVTKYTLIISSALIVPSILGLVIGLVSGLNFFTIDEIGLGLSLQERKDLFFSAVTGVSIYVFEYALLSSFFLGIYEGNKKQFWVYAIILVPVAITCFIFAQTL